MEDLRDYLKRWRWLDWLLVRAEAYTALAEQYPPIKWILRAVVAAMIGLYTFVQESWLALAILATVGTFIVLALIPRVFQRKAISDRLSGDANKHWSDDAPEDAPDRTAYYDLMGFAINYLLPACDRQVELQKAIMRHISENDEVAELAIEGLRSSNIYSASEFWRHYTAIVEGVSSSEYTIKFSALIDCIKMLEGNIYRRFSEMPDNLAAKNNFQYKSNEATGDLWEAWRAAHNKMVSEYDENIKKHVRFGRLFKPLRESRWGGTIEPISD